MSKRQDERLLLEHIPYAHFRNSMQHAYLHNGDRFTHFQPNGLPNMPFAEHPSIVLLQQKFKQLEQNKKSRGGNQLHRIPLVHNGSQQQLLTDAPLTQQRTLTKSMREQHQQMLEKTIPQQQLLREATYFPTYVKSQGICGLDWNYSDMEQRQIMKSFSSFNNGSENLGQYTFNDTTHELLSAHQNYQKNRPVRTSGTEPQQALVLRSHLVSKEAFFQGNTGVTAGINSSSATISPEYKHVSAHTGASNNVKLDDSNLYLTSGINSGFLPPQTAPKPLSDTCAYSYEQSGSSLSLRTAQPSESQITIELALGGEESYHLSGPAQGYWSTNYASNNRQEAIDLEPDTTLRL